MSESDAGRAGGTGGTSTAVTPLCPSSCTSPGDFFCDDAADRSTCRCEEARPTTDTHCANEYQFRCTDYAPADCTDSLSTARTGCYCDETALTPEDCVHTSQFVCETNWPERTMCSCDPTRPASEADCVPSEPYFYCRSNNPAVDCRCVSAIPIK
jgi:hypothetical protein